MLKVRVRSCPTPIAPRRALCAAAGKGEITRETKIKETETEKMGKRENGNPRSAPFPRAERHPEGFDPHAELPSRQLRRVRELPSPPPVSRSRFLVFRLRWVGTGSALATPRELIRPTLPWSAAGRGSRPRLAWPLSAFVFAAIHSGYCEIGETRGAGSKFLDHGHAGGAPCKTRDEVSRDGV